MSQELANALTAQGAWATSLRQPATTEDLQELVATLLEYDEAEERGAGRQRAR